MAECRACHSNNLKKLISFPDYPIFIGCSDAPAGQDELYDFEIFLCRECGFMQQVNIPPLSVLYRENRAFGIGGIWKQHYEEYIKFIEANAKLGEIKDVLEVGGGNGVVLRHLLTHKNLKLTDVEPNPQYGNLEGVTTERRYFDSEFPGSENRDLIYCSHLIEHVTDPDGFLATCARLLRPGGALVTACPNVLKSFENNHLNAFTTDHLNYFSPARLESLAARHGLEKEAFFQYRDHGMYFLFRKTGKVVLNNTREQAVELEQSFQRWEQTIQRFADAVKNQVDGPYYVFGAHAFTITFLRFLERSKQPIRSVLDNEPTKQGRRLCGTELICESPAILSDADHPTVVVYMGAYTKEISSQLKTLNPGSRLIRLDEFAGGGSN